MAGRLFSPVSYLEPSFYLMSLSLGFSELATGRLVLKRNSRMLLLSIVMEM
jgi:hypothetical protein